MRVPAAQERDGDAARPTPDRNQIGEATFSWRADALFVQA